jgi:bacterioferritin-associated ferredoxin
MKRRFTQQEVEIKVPVKTKCGHCNKKITRDY